ncbi:MAG TPA: BamA/TamA family outer membrane protein [Steroidobacteraceae bacterium]|nr:BamA/TamA family outer membrane protein [Steroidobacteraceae bacterium]
MLLVCAAVHAPCASAADPQSYRVEFASTGNAAIDSTIKATSQLQALRTSAPVNPYGLIARARSDIGRLKTVLESFGYYESMVTITINGLALDAPSLGETLLALPKQTDARIRIALEPGPLFHLGSIGIDGSLPAGMQSALELKGGEPAVASVVLAGGVGLQTALQDRGYAFATVDPPTAYEDDEKRVLNLKFHVVVGPRVNVGEIHFQGLQRTHAAILRRRLLLHTGDPYSAASVEKARKDLLNLGVFASVSVRLGSKPDSLGRVPVTFVLRERPRHAFGITGSYSSDLGVSGGITWNDRNLFGNAEELDLSATLINLGGTATQGVGYDSSARYIIPDVGYRDQSLQFSLRAIKQDLQAYNQTAETAAVTLSRKISSVWTASVGASAETEQIIQGGCIGKFAYELASDEPCTSDPTAALVPLARYYTLVGVPFSVAYDSTDLATPLDDPTHGTRGAFNFSPTRSIGESSGQPNATFLIAQASISHYLDFHDLVGTAPGRTVLAARAMGGIAKGAGELDLPPDQRFYAGGSGTVRGYNYQSVGPQFTNPGGNPIGGTAMAAVNLELRQRIVTNFGTAIFVDAGGVTQSQSLNPLSSGTSCAEPPRFAAQPPSPSQSGVFCVGAGTGVRYYTPIGPVRVDFAVPLVRRPDDARFEVYIGLGQAF